MNPQGKRVFGRVLQGLGILASVSGTLTLAGSAVGAAPGPSFLRLIHVVAAAFPPFPELPMTLGQPSPGPSGSPSPEPSPSPTEAPYSTPSPAPLVIPRGGPIQLALIGSLSAGKSFNQSSIGGSTTNDALTNEALGLSIDLQRHTATSSSEIRLPLGLGNHGSTFGLPAVTYARPTFLLSFGQQQTSLFGVVPPGFTNRGYAYSTSLGGTDVTLFGGSTAGANGEAIRIGGIRMRKLVKAGLLELSAAQGSGGQSTGPSTLVTAGYAASLRNTSIIAEGAYQTRNAPDGRRSGIAYGLRIDRGLGANGATFALSKIPDRFLIYGGGESTGTGNDDLAVRRVFGTTNIAYEIGRSTMTGFGSASASLRQNASVSGRAFGSLQFSVNVANAKTTGDQPTQRASTAQVQLAAPIRYGFALAGVLFGKVSQDGSPDMSNVSYTAQLQRQVGPYAVSFGVQNSRQSGDGGVAKNSIYTTSLTRNFGKTGLGFTYSLNTVDSATSQMRTSTPLLLVTRQLSPALSLQAQYGQQRSVDALNPTANGRSRLFSIQVNAPFQFGNSGIHGRVDPRLPSTVTGRVMADVGNSPGLVAAAGSGGVGNIGVILDGQYVQRTDFSGTFQFPFVKPGPHQLRIDTTTIPRGLSVDQPVIVFTIQGGQRGDYYFRIGNYGAVYGHVLGRTSNGATIPLANVSLRLDSGAYAQTDQQGNFGFGHLTAGDHVVSVIENTVPAFAAFSKDALQRRFSVGNGQIVNLDFLAEPLGSIGGTVKFDVSVRPDFVGPAANAYVVAEPGDFAAIVGDDGSYIIDNLPPGTYTVSIDGETLPDGLGQLEPDFSETLNAHEHVSGVDFLVGKKIKHVVFSFVQGDSGGAVTVTVSEPKLPPMGTADALVEAPSNLPGVTVSAFGKTYKAEYDSDRKSWIARFAVPEDAKSGKATIVATAKGKSASTTIDVDPKTPLSALQITTANAQLGEYVAVRARFLADVAAGDRIVWDDGQVTTLQKAVSGRIFAFSLHLTKRPMQGTLFTKTTKVGVRVF